MIVPANTSVLDHPAVLMDGWRVFSSQVKDAQLSGRPMQLQGTLLAIDNKWLGLSVPKPLVRGLFDALHEPGIELPSFTSRAFFVVMTPDEVRKIGGLAKITERGHSYGYTLGKMTSFAPSRTPEFNQIWCINVSSPDLEKIRASYGLSAQPDHPFHLAVAVRRPGVLRPGGVTKQSSDTLRERVRVVARTPAGKYLLEYFDNPKYPDNLGKTRFPGGGVEDGEDYVSAAIRELREETGYAAEPSHFRYIGPDPRKELAHEHYLELLEHKLKPGSRADNANPGSKVTLIESDLGGDKYIGPDASFFATEKTASLSSKLCRAIESCPASGYGNAWTSESRKEVFFSVADWDDRDLEKQIRAAIEKVLPDGWKLEIESECRPKGLKDPTSDWQELDYDRHKCPTTAEKSACVLPSRCWECNRYCSLPKPGPVRWTKCANCGGEEEPLAVDDEIEILAQQPPCLPQHVKLAISARTALMTQVRAINSNAPLSPAAIRRQGYTPESFARMPPHLQAKAMQLRHQHYVQRLDKRLTNRRQKLIDQYGRRLAPHERLNEQELKASLPELNRATGGTVASIGVPPKELDSSYHMGTQHVDAATPMALAHEFGHAATVPKVLRRLSDPRFAPLVEEGAPRFVLLTERLANLAALKRQSELRKLVPTLPADPQLREALRKQYQAYEDGLALSHLHGVASPAAIPAAHRKYQEAMTTLEARLRAQMAPPKAQVKTSAKKPLRPRVEIYAISGDKILTGRTQPGSLTAFGGGVDKNEPPHKAVARELKEETGYKVVNVKRLPLPPVSVRWHDEGLTLTPKQKARRRLFSGDRTTYFTGIVVGQEKPKDPTKLKEVRFRTIPAILTNLEKHDDPYARAHKRNLQHLLEARQS